MSSLLFKKLLVVAAFGGLLLASSNVNAQLIVYEGFEYTTGDNIVGLNGGTGFAGPYTGVGTAGAGTGNVDVVAGSTFGTLDVAGNGLARSARSGRSVISRELDPAAIAALAGDGTIYFSALVDVNADGTTAGTEITQPPNAFATLLFGSDASTDAGSGVANTVNPGDAIGFGFFGAPTIAGTGIQAVTFDDGVLTQGNPTGQSVVIGDNLAFIVGSIEFNSGGTDDVITLYNVAETDTALGTAFATLSADLDNSTFDTISISDGQASAFDEIRFGLSLADVTPGQFAAVPEPSSMMILIGLSGLGMIRRRK